MAPRRIEVDEQMIEYLAAGKRVHEVASILNVSKRTVVRRLNDAAFRAKVQAVRNEICEAIRADVRRSAALAVQTLESLLVADDPRIRLGAAKALLENFTRLHPPPSQAEPPPSEGDVVEYVQKIIVTSPGSTDALDSDIHLSRSIA